MFINDSILILIYDARQIDDRSNLFWIDILEAKRLNSIDLYNSKNAIISRRQNQFIILKNPQISKRMKSKQRTCTYLKYYDFLSR